MLRPLLMLALGIAAPAALHAAAPDPAAPAEQAPAEKPLTAPEELHAEAGRWVQRARTELAALPDETRPWKSATVAIGLVELGNFGEGLRFAQSNPNPETRWHALRFIARA